MQIQDRLFRKVSLNRLSSPEQLDLMMEVIPPKGWVALISLCFLILVILLWGIFGTVSTTVTGKCILIQSGGLASVTTKFGGRISEIMVKIGDSVKKGDTIAQLSQPELMDKLKAAQAHLHELEVHKQQIRSFSSENRHLKSAYTQQELKNMESRKQTLEIRIGALTDRVDSEEKLLTQGLITKQALLTTQIELSSAKQELGTVKSQLQASSITKLEGEKATQNEETGIELQINEAKRGIDTLDQDIQLSTRINSSYEGKVVEIKAGVGMLVSPGGAVVTIEPMEKDKNDIEAVVYLAATDGKKVHNGMAAHIVPSTVKREEFGFMLGQVTSVADYPASPEGMMKVLENQQLVKELAGDSLPIEIRAKLLPDSTLSGFKWSSSAGPQIKIASGTMCSTEVIVMRQRPINLVIPFLKKNIGVD
jgi:HlyD family secretion protein